MMYQCGRCGLTRASSQEPMGLAMPQCKCAWEFVPPVAPQRTWVGLTDEEVGDLSDFAYANDEEFVRNVEKYLKEKNNG